MVGTPVFRIVVSSDSMKKATAISQGSRRLLESPSEAGVERLFAGAGFCGLDELGGISLHDRLNMRDQLSLIQLRFHLPLLCSSCWKRSLFEGKKKLQIGDVILSTKLKPGNVEVTAQIEGLRRTNWENRTEPYSDFFHFI